MSNKEPGRQKLKTVIVLSPPRSGSSALMNLLANIGLDLGNQNLLKPPDQFNRRGYFEDIEIMRINDDLIGRHTPSLASEILSHFGILSPEFSENVKHWGWALAREPLSELENLPPELVKRMSEKCLSITTSSARTTAWKDARFCVTLPIWRSHINPICLILWRHPLEVAESMKRSSGLPITFGLQLWSRYTRFAFHVSRGLSRMVISYNDLVSKKESLLTSLTDFLMKQEVFLDKDNFNFNTVSRTERHHTTLDANAIQTSYDSELFKWLSSGPVGDVPESHNFNQSIQSDFGLLPLIGSTNLLQRRILNLEKEVLSLKTEISDRRENRLPGSHDHKIKLLMDVNQCVGSKTKSGLYIYISNLIDGFSRLSDQFEKISLLYALSHQLDLTSIKWRSKKIALCPTRIRFKPKKIEKFGLLGLLFTIAIRRTVKTVNFILELLSSRKIQSCNILHNPSGGWIDIKYFDKDRNVVTIHDLIPLRFPHFFSKDALDFFQTHIRQAVKSADVIITPSTHTKIDLIEFFPDSREKLIVIPYGIREIFKPNNSENEWKLFREKYQIPKTDYLLSIRSAEPRKNLFQTIKVFSQLIQDPLFKNLSLILYGGIGPYKDSITETKEWELVRAQTISTPHIPNEQLPLLYSNAKAFLFLSCYEGFGIPPLEAMACGTPVIAGNNSSLPEVIANAGALVDVDDTEEILRALKSILINPVYAKKLSRAGILRAAQFSWSKCASQTLEIYKDILSSPS